MAAADLSVKPITLKSAAEQIKPQTPLQQVVRRFVRHKAAMVGLVVLIAMIAYVLVGSLVYSETYANHNDTGLRLLPPSVEHPFGTDRIGRDILARTIYGGQISLMIGVLAVLVEVGLGTAVGAVAGFYGG